MNSHKHLSRKTGLTWARRFATGLLGKARTLLRGFGPVGEYPSRVKLVHGQYPMSGRPKSEFFDSIGAAKRAVRSIYKDRDGWWFQIYQSGKEVWSSDHALAKAQREQ